jgi:hypothetical protein
MHVIRPLVGLAKDKSDQRFDSKTPLDWTRAVTYAYYFGVIYFLSQTLLRAMLIWQRKLSNRTIIVQSAVTVPDRPTVGAAAHRPRPSDEVQAFRPVAP